MYKGIGSLLLLLALAACQSGGDSPAMAVENYLRTRITGDETRLVALACRAREAEARTEAASFAPMNATIKALSCRADGSDGQYTVVACQGEMVTNYAGETRTWDLGARRFRTLQEDGRWKVCGFAR
ncbi:MAG: hypothetical protein CUN49_04685 [Candidatus Thermofonsia Clade 1 bacterium]|jgi:hypothetical protein|uniref:Lipoprotein n=1 Tax=Candidatus Thermofonsia Clade 1 bacterium TaxID=2364210 RepID=A0A2M8PGB8_9CHLR|nr:MAG: hypothetical protein CUN49_04685 [Candidatus Thermofonsia Clade 1 bacterium]RMF52763.1 MAG: hypothetical protein D6749_04120 [Chloroflexota bacterium]